ncbi:MAG: GlcNAc-transferase family protein [Synechococcus sp.]|nr:GlcNAc-transferase family protein [Synechococcus sp.]
MDHTSATIFIQIAAYRDPDLPATLNNLLERAAHPERLHLGICLQLMDGDQDQIGTRRFPLHQHLQVMETNAADSRGACWARRQAQSFFAEEHFLLQIDSHMRVVQDWDLKILETWAACNDPNAVLSVYPNGFQQPFELNTESLPVMAARQFDEYGILKFQGISRYELPKQQPEAPLPNAFVAGGFLFGPGTIITQVPYDPELYFYGEEISLSARLWTHGYNIYCPNRLLFFHLYKSGGDGGDQSPTHWSDHSDWFQLNRRSLVRVHTLLGSLKAAPSNLKPTIADVDNLNLYWLGEQRSLNEYQEWAGVDFSRQSISESARSGLFNA